MPGMVTEEVIGEYHREMISTGVIIEMIGQGMIRENIRTRIRTEKSDQPE